MYISPFRLKTRSYKQLTSCIITKHYITACLKAETGHYYCLEMMKGRCFLSLSILPFFLYTISHKLMIIPDDCSDIYLYKEIPLFLLFIY